jgi:hypothetical protein
MCTAVSVWLEAISSNPALNSQLVHCAFLHSIAMPLDADQKLELFQESFQRHGTEEWSFDSDTKITKISRKTADITHPIDVNDFPFKPMADAQKATNVFDVISEVDAGMDVDAVASLLVELTANNNPSWWIDERVPEVLRPARALPPNSKMQVFFVQPDGQPMAIVKHMTLGVSLLAASAGALCRGSAYTMHYRRNPWGVKKA